MAYAANSAPQEAWARELIRRLNFSGNESVLDVGCGDGKITAALTQMVRRGNVLGLDASPEMIRFARSVFVGRNGLRIGVLTVFGDLADGFDHRAIFQVN